MVLFRGGVSICSDALICICMCVNMYSFALPSSFASAALCRVRLTSKRQQLWFVVVNATIGLSKFKNIVAIELGGWPCHSTRCSTKSYCCCFLRCRADRGSLVIERLGKQKCVYSSLWSAAFIWFKSMPAAFSYHYTFESYVERRRFAIEVYWRGVYCSEFKQELFWKLLLLLVPLECSLSKLSNRW